MRKLLKICEEYAAEFDVIFNGSKSKCMLFSPRSPRSKYSDTGDISPVFCIANKPIEYVTSWPHLGHILRNDLDDSEDILRCRTSLISQVNNVLCYFGKLQCNIKLDLLYTYCSSFYGCHLWDLENRATESIFVSWRKALKRVWNLPYRTHSDLLYCLSNKWPIELELVRRFVLFAFNCINHECSIVKKVSQHALFCDMARSCLGRNIVNGCCRLGLTLSDLFGDRPTVLINKSLFRKLYSDYSANPELSAHASLV
jgi:hypothetical protein